MAWEKKLSNFARRLSESLDAAAAERESRDRDREREHDTTDRDRQLRMRLEISDEWARQEEAQEAATSIQLYAGSPLARMWYVMRERGEHDRQAALTTLYTQRREPGGVYPDPRGPAAFSMRAIIATVAHQVGVTILPIPADRPDPIDTTDLHADRARVTAMKGQSVWLQTYAKRADGEPAQPNIIIIQQEEEEMMLWLASCMLAYISLLPSLLTDPAIPPGPILLPHDSMLPPLIHRYAHALMNVEFDCSQAFGCRCAQIERQLSAPPTDHEQPTTIIAAQRGTAILTQLIRPPTNIKSKLGGNQGERKRTRPPTSDQ